MVSSGVVAALHVAGVRCGPTRRSQRPRGLRRRSSAALLLRLWLRIPLGAWMFVCCECCLLSGRGLCDVLITRPEEPYQLWHVVVSDQETSKTKRVKPATGLWKIQPQWVVTPGKQKQPNFGPGRLFVEVSRSHTIRHRRPVALLCTRNQLVAQVATYTTH